MPAKYFAAASSLPGGLVVLIWIRFCSQPSASISRLPRSPFAGGVVVWLPDGEGEITVCAERTELVPTNIQTATPCTACLQRQPIACPPFALTRQLIVSNSY